MCIFIQEMFIKDNDKVYPKKVPYNCFERDSIKKIRLKKIFGIEKPRAVLDGKIFNGKYEWHRYQTKKGYSRNALSIYKRKINARHDHKQNRRAKNIHLKQK